MAFRSIGPFCLALIGPLPSIGLPSGSITRPKTSGPTGTSKDLPVNATRAPALIPRSLPKITAPISFSPKFRAKAVALLPSELSISKTSLNPASLRP